MTLKLEVEDVKADVLNVIPPQRAADIARSTGLITHNNRWCDVDWRTMESKKLPGIHILGDATLAAPAMPKSASMASNHAKIAAGAIIELLAGRAPSQDTQILNTCYSFVSRTEAIRVSSVHRWNSKAGTLSPVAGSGGVSSARSEAALSHGTGPAASGPTLSRSTAKLVAQCGIRTAGTMSFARRDLRVGS